MARSSFTLAAGTALALAITACPSAEPSTGSHGAPVQVTRRLGNEPAELARSASAAARLAEVRARFRRPRSAPARARASLAATRSWLGHGLAATIIRGTDGRLVPRFEGRPRERGAAELRLAASAAGRTRIADETRGLAIEISLPGARPVPAEQADGTLLYAGALLGGDLIQRPRPDGTEDYVALRREPDEATLLYSVELQNVAGVRFVGNSLEFLEADGTPRLRMAPPKLIDADGAVVPLTVSVTGCRYDDDPRPPWRREVTAPASDECQVALRWRGHEPTYPVLIDPLWSTTADLSTPRSRMGATTLPTTPATVLVAGGDPLDSAELYDTQTETWAATPSPGLDLHTTNYGASTATLIDDAVLVVGGTEPGVYDVQTGTWSATGPYTGSDRGHGAVRLPDGRVMVVGSWGAGDQWLSLYDPTTNTWSAGPPMIMGRELPTATVLQDGRVLVAGGTWWTAEAEIYDPTDGPTGSWTLTSAMSRGRDGLEAALLPDGRVLVISGYNTDIADYPIEGDCEIFDPVSSTWSPAAEGSSGRQFFDVVTRPNGEVVAIGGQRGWSIVTTAERYVAETDSWVSAGTMSIDRRFHAATLLPDGSILVVGGENFVDDELSTVERLVIGNDGAPCASDIECDSLLCVDSVCCDSLCDEPCHACSAAAKGTGIDGVCEPAAAGEDPRQDCLAMHSSSCSTTGACDGAGSCQIYPVGTECAAPSCAEQRSATYGCDASGACVRSTTDCKPYQCDPGGTCRASCSVHAHCSTSHYCDAASGECLPDAALGEPCSHNAGCTTGLCRNERCVEAGRCLDETSYDPGDGTTIDCNPFRCSPTGCYTGCSSVEECADGFICDAAGLCISLSEAAAPQEVDSGCTIGRHRPGSPVQLWWLPGLGLIGALRFRRRRWIAVAILALPFVGGCATDHQRVEDAAPPVPQSTQSEQRQPGLDVALERFAAVLPAAGPIRELVRRGERLEPIIATHGPIRVSLSASGDGATELKWRGTDVSLAFRLETASAAPVALERGYALYRSALPGGATVLHRPRPDGNEDFIFYPHPPEREQVRYTLELTGVAGLRLVADVVELLDSRGVPRLRMRAPWIVDAQGHTHRARVVLGCRHDRDPRPPYGRPVVLATAGCELSLDWSGGSVRYPALLDPTWTATSTMTQPRMQHVAVRLGSGRVLLAGNSDSSSPRDTAEIFDPATNTFATTGSMAEVRARFAGALLHDGRALVAGGQVSGGGESTTAEIYDPVLGTWSLTTGPMSSGRNDHYTVVLSDGRVLVGGDSFDPSVDLFDPVTDTFTATASSPASKPTLLHTDGRLFAFGSATPQVFDPSSETWSDVAPMHRPRTRAGAVWMPGNEAFVVGGSVYNDTLASAEMYDVASDSWTEKTAMSTSRSFDFSLVALPTGQVLAAGGYISDFPFTQGTTELYEPSSDLWIPASPMLHARYDHTTTVLDDQSVLLTGGRYDSGGYGTDIDHDTAERFGLLGLGEPCTDATDCQSQICVSDVCCDTPCDSLCHACTAALKGGGDDGVCEPVRAGTAAPDDTCIDQGADSCGTTGSCDGNGRCALYTEGLPCGSSSCEAGIATATLCNGLGGCVEQTTACTPYRCANDGCADQCSADADCVVDAYCDDDGSCHADEEEGQSCSRPAQCESGICALGQCAAPLSCLQEQAFVDATGRLLPCHPYRCDEQGCFTSCGSVLDCAEGHVCNDAGVCEPPPPPPQEVSGCAMVPGARPQPWGPWLLLGASAFSWRRRRSRHRRDLR